MRLSFPLRTLFFVALTAIAAGAGCARSTIPNTDVEDNVQNREVLKFVEEYRKAVERRDVAALLRMASPKYLDDGGTPLGDDDVDFSGLNEKLQRFRNEVEDVRYEIRYRRVMYHGERIFVDYTYTASFKVAKPEGGSRWARRLADNRLALVQEGGQFRILSGM